MHFHKHLLGAGLIGASLAALPAVPAKAQAILSVVDAQGRPAGVVINTPAFDGPAPAPFTAMNRMMDHDMALVKAVDRQFARMAAQAQQAAPPVQVSQGAAPMVWQSQSYSTFSVGARSLTCESTVTIMQTGNTAPIVHTASTGDNRACARMAAPIAIQGPTVQPKRDIVPAIDIRPDHATNRQQAPF